MEFLESLNARAGWVGEEKREGRSVVGRCFVSTPAIRRAAAWRRDGELQAFT